MDILEKLREHDGEQIGFVRDAIAEIERLRREIDMAEGQNAKLHDELMVKQARLGNLEAQIHRLRGELEKAQSVNALPRDADPTHYLHRVWDVCGYTFFEALPKPQPSLGPAIFFVTYKGGWLRRESFDSIEEAFRYAGRPTADPPRTQ